MVGGYPQGGGAASFQGGGQMPPLPPLNETLGGIAKAMEALEKAVKLAIGYGIMEDCITPNNRTVKHFRKRSFSELTHECKR